MLEPLFQAVLIMRNPLDAALADFNRRSLQNDNVGKVDMEEFYTPQFRAFYDLTVRKSEVLMIMWNLSGKGERVDY